MHANARRAGRSCTARCVPLSRKLAVRLARTAPPAPPRPGRPAPHRVRRECRRAACRSTCASSRRARPSPRSSSSPTSRGRSRASRGSRCTWSTRSARSSARSAASSSSTGSTRRPSFFEGTDDPAEAVTRINTEADVVAFDGHSRLRPRAHAVPRALRRRTSRGARRVLVLGDARNNYHAAQAWVLDDLRYRAKAVYWLNPEPQGYWNSGDSIVVDLRPVLRRGRRVPHAAPARDVRGRPSRDGDRAAAGAAHARRPTSGTRGWCSSATASPTRNARGVVGGPIGRHRADRRSAARQADALAERLGRVRRARRRRGALRLDAAARDRDRRAASRPACSAASTSSSATTCASTTPARLDGLTWAEAVERYALPGLGPSTPTAPSAPGGESLTGFHERCRAALARLAERHARRDASSSRATAGVVRAGDEASVSGVAPEASGCVLPTRTLDDRARATDARRGGSALQRPSAPLPAA